ncbi:protein NONRESPONDING TO OXYLIPINS 2, mitochondrial-like isoform X2 [Henckelia pumila]|uniref:protein NONRESPONDING TO OXYLIPINS 2, mitochondrial-like isoform X2 n=1 Tax=Henckelia pumila TaxID=405737 RepID=UPI003C6DC05B
MASKCCRIFNRASISNAILKPNLKANTTSFSRIPSAPSPLRRSFVSRTPVELGSVASMLPLHSAVAMARMTSCLSPSARSCRALSQELGLSVPR